VTEASVIELDTPHGRARVRLERDGRPGAALVLGHGAGGSIEARDLLAAVGAARELGLAAALVEQPYRVAGRGTPPIAQLETSWIAVVEQLVADELAGARLVVGGRSLGARVACRSASTLGAAAVLCLAFPLQPPRRASGAQPPSRLGELDAVSLPTLVVQGARDPFGVPPPGPGRTVALVPGDHSLRAGLAEIPPLVGGWLRELAL
jgi:predicted alpha/beta-hydrolase family hydrolase